MNLILFALGCLVVSGFAGLAAHRRPALATGIGAAGVVLACAAGLWPALEALFETTPTTLKLAWNEPSGDVLLGLDPLSALFLVPLFALSALAAVYGRDYLLGYRERQSLGPPVLFFNVLIASMALVVVARGAVLFLMAWEVMTVASYLLISFDSGKAEVRRAGWVYLIAAHVGVACLTAMFLVLERPAHGLSFAAFQAMPAPTAGLSAVVFVLAMVAFGIKAGFVPLHVWVPEAHAAAPSHISALMSGVIIKLGLYGLLRVLTFLPLSPWWGPTLIVVGLAGALIGISLALYQRDLKKVLAYSTIENVGLITLGLGIAYWGQSRGDVKMAALGAAGALLHLWNHVLMKGLLFFSAGSVVHGTGTKDLEKLGGLMKRMPRTGLAMLLGAVAIAGLPPMNGFVSEWLLYRGLIAGGVSHPGTSGIFALLAVGVLSFVGGLTALCFVRLTGVALLGEARSAPARQAHEASAWMTGPMLTLASGAVLFSLFPGPVSTALVPAVTQVFGPDVGMQMSGGFASLATLGTFHFFLWIALGVGGLLLWKLTQAPAPVVGTWDCGYAQPTPRMQYTARSFSDLFERLLPQVLRARVEQRGPASYFPANGRYDAKVEDPVTRGAYEPFLARAAGQFARLRWLQHGSLHMYLLYILVVVVLGLAWVTWRSWGT